MHTDKEVSIEKFVKEQVRKWDNRYSEEQKRGQARIPVITVGMEPGSGGSVVARGIAERLGFDVFNREIIEGIAKSSRIRSSVIESLEKERLSGIEDFIASLVKKHYMYPGIYLRHLLEVVSALGKHGRAVIVGRGANFILPPEERFSVRVVAPLEIRIENVSRAYKVSRDVAERRVINRESRRRAFVRQSFNSDISDPLNYDLVINTGGMTIDSAVDAVIGAVMGSLSKKK
jgi:cytidylate kinase